ncbi:GNAT family N-acetyltransferase [Streptomyces sp. YIM S03343]
MSERFDSRRHQSPPLLGTLYADQRAAAEMVLLDPQSTVIGRLRFRTCNSCRTGLILDIWIHETFQRQGLARELVHDLLAHRHGFRWTTTRQTTLGQHFFRAMTQETSVSFSHGGPLCVHVAGPFARMWRRLISRCGLASADSTTY